MRMTQFAYLRLQVARERAGYKTAREAAELHGWKNSTYKAHEAGYYRVSLKAGKQYASAFNVAVDWLLTGEGEEINPKWASLNGPFNWKYELAVWSIYTPETPDFIWNDIDLIAIAFKKLIKFA